MAASRQIGTVFYDAVVGHIRIPTSFVDGAGNRSQQEYDIPAALFHSPLRSKGQHVWALPDVAAFLDTFRPAGVTSVVALGSSITHRRKDSSGTVLQSSADKVRI